MRIILITALFILSISIALASPVEISVTKTNFGSVEVFGKPAVTKSGSNDIEISNAGSEKSECRNYGRAGSAKSQTSTDILSKTASSVFLEMKSLVSAHGGHYRTCATCIEKNCVGIFGNDTSSLSNSKASATIKINFNDDYPDEEYVLNINQNLSNSSIKYTLSDSNNKLILTTSTFVEPVKINPKDGKTYFLKAEMINSAFNEGGCCNDVNVSSALIDVVLDKAPILASMGVAEPYIVGGQQTNSYKSVGALTINNKLHCTGTLITDKTILTAAHCLFGYDTQIENMRFLIGPNVNQPDFGPYKIESFIYPNGDMREFKYNPRNYEDDIGLIYLKEPVLNVVRGLHSGDPSWSSIIENRTSLLFVGYGYDVLDNERIGLGIKREASWYINEYSNRTVSFKVEGKNTCKGDSGGPTFLKYSGKLIQVAVTSTGSSSCDRGVQTRLDAYSLWLEKNIL